MLLSPGWLAGWAVHGVCAAGREWQSHSHRAKDREERQRVAQPSHDR